VARPAINLAQDRESSPAKTDGLTTRYYASNMSGSFKTSSDCDWWLSDGGGMVLCVVNNSARNISSRSLTVESRWWSFCLACQHSHRHHLYVIVWRHSSLVMTSFTHSWATQAHDTTCLSATCVDSCIAGLTGSHIYNSCLWWFRDQWISCCPRLLGVAISTLEPTQTITY